MPKDEEKESKISFLKKQLIENIILLFSNESSTDTAEANPQINTLIKDFYDYIFSNLLEQCIQVRTYKNASYRLY